jgi:hypothetical protein
MAAVLPTNVLTCVDGWLSAVSGKVRITLAAGRQSPPG